MSAAEIIEQIKRLPAEEREKVRNFVRLDLPPGQLPGEELAALGEKMISTKDPAEAKRLEDELVQPALPTWESGRRGPRGPRPPTPPDVLIVSGGFRQCCNCKYRSTGSTKPCALNHALFMPR